MDKTALIAEIDARQAAIAASATHKSAQDAYRRLGELRTLLTDAAPGDPVIASVAQELAKQRTISLDLDTLLRIARGRHG